MVLYVNVLGFGGGVWGFDSSDSVGVVDVKEGWDGELECMEVVEEVLETVRVL